MGHGELSEAFLARGAIVEASRDDLDASLRARIAAGREAWPDIALGDVDFVVHLADRVHRAELPALAHAADLWLACGCVRGIEAAAGALARGYRAVIDRAVSRVASWDADDAVQQILTTLLVPVGACPPRIAEYAGRAPLRAWIKTVAARTALNRRRRMDAQPHESVSALADVATRGDPDLQLLRARFTPELDDAMRGAFASLDARQRLLLRASFVDGWSIDRIAAVYAVGRSTAARWVSAAREALLAATKAQLRHRLGVDGRELESILRLLESDLLAVSVVRLLGEADPG